MEPEILPPTSHPVQKSAAPQPSALPAVDAENEIKTERGLSWVFIGDHGLRAGWSVFLFAAATFVFLLTVGTLEMLFATRLFHQKPGAFTPFSAMLQESSSVLAILCAGWLLARIEGRRLMDFNLSGPSRLPHFLSGLAAGFAALSLLVCFMRLGGWIAFGPAALHGSAIFTYAVLWAVAFLLVGCFEEGSFRGYLQFTFTRGLNFWWAAAFNALLCLILAALTLINHPTGSAFSGVYAFVLLGLPPCLLLQLQKAPSTGFWNAAWVTSTLFGFIHTGNGGENWVGIFAAAAIGLVFCVSLRLTGSIWWAIGCHAAWDWAETFFYGTADSGLVATGHFLSTTPTGNALWSGGADGPEGSLLVLPVIALLLALLLVLYSRNRRTASPKSI
jgi:hypothetical protein